MGQPFLDGVIHNTSVKLRITSGLLFWLEQACTRPKRLEGSGIASQVFIGTRSGTFTQNIPLGRRQDRARHHKMPQLSRLRPSKPQQYNANYVKKTRGQVLTHTVAYNTNNLRMARWVVSSKEKRITLKITYIIRICEPALSLNNDCQRSTIQRGSAKHIVRHIFVSVSLSKTEKDSGLPMGLTILPL